MTTPLTVIGGPCDFDVVETGNISGSADLPGIFDTSGFDFNRGLGTLQAKITDAGLHQFIALFDHEIELSANDIFNETGSILGDPAAGQRVNSNKGT